MLLSTISIGLHSSRSIGTRRVARSALYSGGSTLTRIAYIYLKEMFSMRDIKYYIQTTLCNISVE